jgi:GTP-binding protein HflX
MNNKNINILVVGLITPLNKMVNKDAYFSEFMKLIETNFITPKATYFTTLREIDSAFFVTKGKLEELKKICIENDIDEVIFSEKLSPHQEMRLEKTLDATVFDRTHLILEIFEKQAFSEEAKIQVKIAFLEHKKTRVAGHGSHFSQQAGRFGIISGAGETQKELDLRHIDHLLVKLKRELKHIEEHKGRQRKDRIKNNIFQIAIVGYTNAGKSTLFNTLTKSSLLAEDKLFATLTTTTRKLFLNDELMKKVVITDTVGFIQNIPHELIESFNSTISEILFASLLLHVIDVSNPDWINHYLVVKKTIDDLGAKNIPTIIVFNKVDLIPENDRADLNETIKQYIPDSECIFTDARSKDIVDTILLSIEKHIVIKK